MKEQKYLATCVNNKLSCLYEVIKETAVIYVVEVNSMYSIIVPKDTMQTGDKLSPVFWRLATEEDLLHFKKRDLVSFLRHTFQDEETVMKCDYEVLNTIKGLLCSGRD